MTRQARQGRYAGAGEAAESWARHAERDGYIPLVTGEWSERVRLWLTIPGLLVLLLAMGRMICADIT